MEKYRSRAFDMVIYPNEDKSHSEALQKLISLDNNHDIALAYIAHDKDLKEGVNPEGELTSDDYKKHHVHVVVRFKDARWNTKLAKDLGITENYIQACNYVDGSLLYLIHSKNPEKHQYPLDEVHGTLKARLNELILKNDCTEGERVLKIVEYIISYDGPISMTKLIIWAADNGLWDVLRRGGALLKEVVSEHNAIYSRKEI